MNKSIDDYKKESLEYFKRRRVPPEELSMAVAAVSVPDNIVAKISEADTSGTGGLVVIVTHSRGLFPVENAKVSVFNTNTTLITQVLTDRSGKTDRIELPAPRKSNSESPGMSANDVAGFYNVKVESEGFVPIYLEDIPVFDSVTSLQKVDLTYNSVASSEEMQIIEFPRQNGL